MRDKRLSAFSRLIRRFMNFIPISFRLCLFFVLAVGFATSMPASATSVRVTQVDGKAEDFTWGGLSADGAVQLQPRAGGSARTISLDAVMAIDFENEVQESPGKVVFYLADGGTLKGELTSGSSDSVSAETVLAAQTKLPFDRLAAIQLTARSKFEFAGELFQEALAARLPGQDILVTKSVEDAKSLRGRVESLGATDGDAGESGGALKGVFNIGGRSRTFALPKLYGIVFAAGAAALPAYGATVSLVDGSKFRGWVESGDESHVQCKTSFGSVIDVPVVLIQRLEIHSDRVTWLSDLTPVNETGAGMLSKPWPSQRDRSVASRPLTMDGKVFPKGIGVRAKSELSYDIGGTYACFAATVGIDDYVRPRGNVTFSVLGDEKVLLDNVAVGGRDAGQDVAVDVSGVKKLTLRVDYGEDLDLSDHADWCGARLLKKNPDGSHPCAKP